MVDGREGRSQGWRFTDVTTDAGLTYERGFEDIGLFDYGAFPSGGVAAGDYDGDYDGDGWLDLLILGIEETTVRLFRNRGDETFVEVTRQAGIDPPGDSYSAAFGDYDGDGDLDWFVSSIWNPDGRAEGNWGTSGNRLYENVGRGRFRDATEGAGVRIGYWGWGSTFGGLDNDGDLYHVNGYGLVIPETAEYHEDPAVLFISNGDGTFSERGEELGLTERGQGRGLVCFDYDRDGDLDFFIANNMQSPRLDRNDGGNRADSLQVRLDGPSPNSEAIGARIGVTAGGRTQLRELRSGCNYVFQNPAEAHFGLGESDHVDELQVTWPDGREAVLHDLATRRLVRVTHPSLERLRRGDANGDARADLSDALRVLGFLFLGDSLLCHDAADSNDDARIDVSDAIFILEFLFVGSAFPPQPFPDCGPDRTRDDLGCLRYPACAAFDSSSLPLRRRQ